MLKYLYKLAYSPGGIGLSKYIKCGVEDQG